jgi:hypothetical protein
VSIKKKFATTVATASLLAGLFGSAFVPVAYAGAGTLDATETTFAETNTLTGDGLLSTTPLQLVSSTMAAVAETDATITFTVEDSNGAVIPQNTVYTVTGTGTVLIAGASANTTSATGYVGASGAVVIEVAASSSTAAGTGTLVLTIGGGSETVYYRAVGAVASITLTNVDAFTHLAAATAGTADALTYAEVDAAGFALPATATASVTYSKDGATAGAIGAAAATTAGTYVNAGTAAGKLTIASGSCATADAGKTRTIAIKIGTITSNTVSFICTLGGGSAVLTGAALADNTLYPLGTSKVTYTFTDGTRQLGFGAVIGTMAVVAVDFPNSLNSVSVSTKSNIATATWDATGLVVDKSGKATSAAVVVTAAATVAVGPRMVLLSIADSDLAATTDVAKEIKLSYSIVDEGVTAATLVAGPKKLKATATFGASAANKKIAFTLENATSGVVKTYYRKADASGVATFTLRFRGTFDVTAAYGDELTDTVELKK